MFHFWLVRSGTPGFNHIVGEITPEPKRTLLVGVVAAVAIALTVAGVAYEISPSQSRLSSTVSSFSLSSLSSSSTISQTSCLVSVPGNAQLADFANSTFNGNNVTYANGTSVLFSYYGCPRPAFAGSSQGADVYAMAAAAVENSSFVAAENGSQFIYYEPSGLVCGIGGVEPCNMTIFFYSYSNTGTTIGCGNGLGPPTQMLYLKDALAGIQVMFHTKDPAYNSEVNGNTGWDLQDPTIQAMTQVQISMAYFVCGG
jgi:hypothetical protein